MCLSYYKLFRFFPSCWLSAFKSILQMVLFDFLQFIYALVKIEKAAGFVPFQLLLAHLSLAHLSKAQCQLLSTFCPSSVINNSRDKSLDNKFVIFSDSLSALKSLNHTSSKNLKIQDLIEQHHELSKTKKIVFCWLPSQIGKEGNEAADVKAKSSLDLEISNFKLPCTDFKPFINRYILFKWQMSWD